MPDFTALITKNRKTIFSEQDDDYRYLLEIIKNQLYDIMFDELARVQHSTDYNHLGLLTVLFDEIDDILPENFFKINRFCEDFGIHVSISKGGW